MNKKVEIYTKSICAYCDMAKNFFDQKRISYEVYNADDPTIFQEMLKRNPAARTVPQIPPKAQRSNHSIREGDQQR